MIYLYTGTPGSGKSYHAAQVVDRALHRNIPVIANFEVNPDPKRHKGEFIYIDTLDMSPDFFIQYAEDHFKPGKDEHQGIIIIDEAQIPFNSREGLNRNRMKWISFFSKHRHYFYDVILITQHDRMIDRQIRSLVETEYKHRKLTNFGAKGWFMIVIFHKMFVAVQYWYPIQEKVGSEFFNLSKRVCKLYDTFKRFDNSDILKISDDFAAKAAEFNKTHNNVSSEDVVDTTIDEETETTEKDGEAS